MTSLFSRDSDVVLFGTGADELWVGYEDVRRQFARNFAEAEAVRFEWTWRHVSGTETSAWAAATANVHVTVGGARRTIPIRFSVALERHDGDWKCGFIAMLQSQPAARAPVSHTRCRMSDSGGGFGS